MKRAVRFLALLLSLPAAACGGCGPDEESFPEVNGGVDPRLGTLVFQAAIRGPAILTGRGSAIVQPSIAAMTVDDAGTGHVVFGVRLYRVWGEEETRSGLLVYRTVSPGGEVASPPAPHVAEPILGTPLPTGCQASGHFVLGFHGDVPAGQVLTLHAFDGEGWTRRDLLRSHLPDPSAPSAFSKGNGQLRCLSSGQLIVQHANKLMRTDGQGWVSVPVPRDAVNVRLGPASAAGVRLIWDDAAGSLHTDVIDAAGNLSGDESVLWFAEAKIGEGFSWAGSLDTFVVDAGVVARFAKGGFRLVAPSAPLDAGPLNPTGHPHRAVRSRGGTFSAVFQGVDTGALGTWEANQAIECPACRLESIADTEAGVAEGEDCDSCVPRTVLGAAWHVLPDASGLGQLTLDWFQNGIRVYLKRVPFPLDGPPAVQSEGGPFPGEVSPAPEDPTPADDRPVTLSGRALRLGSDDHAGVAVRLTGTSITGAPVDRSVDSRTDGSFSFPPMPCGDYQVAVGETSRAVTAATFGQHDVGTFLEGLRPVAPANFDPATSEGVVDPDGQHLIGLSGGTIHMARVNGESATLATQATAVRVLDDFSVAWNEGTCPGAGCVLKAAFQPNAASQLSPGVPVDWLRPIQATFVFPDGQPATGQTIRQWKRWEGGSTVSPWYPVAEAWPLTDGGSGGYTLAWENAPGTGLFGSALYDRVSYSTNVYRLQFPTDVPFLHDVRSASILGRFIGFTSPGCAAGPPWTKECSAFVGQVSGGNPPTTVDRVRWVKLAEDPSEPSLALVQRQDGPALIRLGFEGGSVDVATGLSLPTQAHPGEEPGYLVNGYLFWRDDRGLWRRFVGTSTDDLLVPGAVRAVRATWNGSGYLRPVLMVHTGEPTTPMCEKGCGVVVVDLNSGGSVSEVLPAGQARGREVMGHAGFFHETLWKDCPGAPCTVVWRDGAPVTIGEIWPDRRIRWTAVPVDRGYLIDRRTGSPAAAFVR